MARRSVADAAETRMRILAQARAMFAAQGYAGSSARDIAAASGVTVGALFHHFGTKAGLFRVVFEQLVSEMNDAAMDMFRSSGTTDPLDAIVRSLRVALGFAQRPDFNRIVAVDGPFVLGTDEWHKIDSRLGLRTVAGGIESLKTHGRIVSEHPTIPLAVLIMGAMSNAGFALARQEPGTDMESLLAAFRRLIEGLAPAT
jgi:AcrR family transcriptional regulator